MDTVHLSICLSTLIISLFTSKIASKWKKANTFPLYNDILTIESINHIRDKFCANYMDLKLKLVITGINAISPMSDRYKRGFEIDKLLREHHKEENISQGLYVLAFDCDGDENNDESYFPQIAYIGQTNPEKKELRYRPCSHISKLLKILNDSTGFVKNQHRIYQKILERIIEYDKWIHPRLNLNIPYDGRIVEGVVYEANVLSGRKLFPNLSNIHLETIHLNREYEHIFENGQEDYIALAVFHIKNLIQTELRQEFIPVLNMNFSLQNKTLICNICSLDFLNYLGLFQHLRRAKDAEHVQAYEKARENEGKGLSFAGHSKYEDSFKLAEYEKQPTKVIVTNRKMRKFNRNAMADMDLTCAICKKSFTGDENFGRHFRRNHPNEHKKIEKGDAMKSIGKSKFDQYIERKELTDKNA